MHPSSQGVAQCFPFLAETCLSQAEKCIQILSRDHRVSVQINPHNSGVYLRYWIKSAGRDTDVHLWLAVNLDTESQQVHLARASADALRNLALNGENHSLRLVTRLK